MTDVRIIIWPVLLLSYAAPFAAVMRLLLGKCSGAENLGALFAIFVGASSLAGDAKYLWRKKLIHGWVRTEAAFCAAVRVEIVLLFASSELLGKR